MQQCRLAGARRTNQRDDFARPQGEIDAVQHLELGSGEPEDAAHVPQFERGGGFDHLRASFEMAAFCGLLRMRGVFDAISSIPHAEERPCGPRLEARMSSMQPSQGYS